MLIQLRSPMTFGFMAFRLVVAPQSFMSPAVFPVVGNKVICCFAATRVRNRFERKSMAPYGLDKTLIAYATGRELKDKLEGRLVIDGTDAAGAITRFDSIGNLGDRCGRPGSATGAAQCRGLDRGTNRSRGRRGARNRLALMRISSATFRFCGFTDGPIFH